VNTPQGPQPHRQNQPPYGQPPPPYGQPQYGQRPAPPHYGQPQYAPPPAPPQYRPPPPQRQYGQPPAQQQYGQPPAQQQYGHPSEGIAVTTHFFPLAWLFFFIKPKIFIDGHESPPAAWGRTVLPARPGQHQVHVYTPYFLPSRVGPADATADVRPGQVTELEYKAPLWSFSPGSLGVGPQKYNGVGITIAVIAIPFVILIFFFLLMMLLAVI
jgi:hypothetical protein